jgi:hypothetical protein
MSDMVRIKNMEIGLIRHCKPKRKLQAFEVKAQYDRNYRDNSMFNGKL